MKKKEYKYTSIRIDIETYEALKSIALYEGRTVSRQALYWIRRAIE